MDTKQIIILIIIIAVYLYNTIRKANAKARENQHDNTFEPDHELETYDEVDFEPEYSKREHPSYDSYEQTDYTQMLKNRQIIAESLETSSLETESLETNITPQTYSKTPKKTNQNTEYEEDNAFEISTELDEVKKGFIYSEILKRKYN